MSQSTRFQRYGKDTLSIEKLIKDCRDLESELRKEIETLKERVKQLENGG